MTSFKEYEIPDDVKNGVTKEIRCPIYNSWKRGPCNRLLARGDFGTGPLELFCPKCRQRVIFKKIE